MTNLLKIDKDFSEKILCANVVYPYSECATKKLSRFFWGEKGKFARTDLKKKKRVQDQYHFIVVQQIFEHLLSENQNHLLLRTSL